MVSKFINIADNMRYAATLILAVAQTNYYKNYWTVVELNQICYGMIWGLNPKKT